MYCQSCGADAAPELSYCKRCGATLNAAPLVVQSPAQMVSVTKPTLIISATILLLTLGGFAAVIMGALALATTAGIRQDPIMAVVMLGMFTILISDIILAKQLSRLITYSMKKPDVIVQQPRALPPENVSWKIPAPVHGVPSVTENTTRTLSTGFRDEEPVAAKAMRE